MAVRSDGERPVVLAIGEVEAARTMDGRDVDRLVRIRDLLRRRKDVDASDTRLLLFSDGGFSDGLRERERAGDVALVNLERLSEGE